MPEYISKIGVFGGSFDPVHNRHIQIAQEALDQFQLDKVIFIPTVNPPHKTSLKASIEDRIMMLQLALVGNKKFEVSKIEMNREGYAYTYDTLIELTTLYPKTCFYYIIGEDSLNYLDKWHRANDLFKLTNFIVCNRFHDKKDRRKEIEKAGAKLYFLKTAAKDISSTKIRQDLKDHNNSNEIPKTVLEYILEKNLYNTDVLPCYFSSYISKLINLIEIKRFAHSLGVAYEARKLAIIYNQDYIKATEAGLLHDCAKNLPINKMQLIADMNNLDLDLQTYNSELLHAPVGSILAKTAFGVTDNNVLSAIFYHTTGNYNMNLFDMIIYLSDKIEPGRPSYPQLNEIRKLAEKDIHAAMIMCIESTAKFLEKHSKPMHKDTLRLLITLKNRGEKYGI